MSQAWGAVVQALTAFAIIYGAAYAIGFIVALFKHRKEVADAAKQTKVSQDTKVWLILGCMMCLVVVLKRMGY